MTQGCCDTCSHTVCVFQEGGWFGRRMSKLPDKLRRATKSGVAAGDDTGPTEAGAAAEVANTTRVLAVADWAGDTDIIGAMGFTNGDAGDLMYVSNQGWVCVRVHDRTGWVPATHWRIVTDVRPLSFPVYNTVR